MSLAWAPRVRVRVLRTADRTGGRTVRRVLRHSRRPALHSARPPRPSWSAGVASVTAERECAARRQRSGPRDVWEGEELAYQEGLIEQSADVFALAGKQLKERVRPTARLTSA